MLETAEKPRLRLLLDHFALVEDDREAWRVAHPLPEVLLLVVCGTIAAGDDFEDIADWGEDNLAFLFADCFQSWRPPCVPMPPVSWPSTARPRAAVTIVPRDGPRCTWFRSSPRASAL